jgi:membrane fusion protein, multidrug efflux system
MKAARFAAVGLVVVAVGWIASGHLFPHETPDSKAAVRTGEAENAKLFRVAVIDAHVAPRSRKLVLSGRTEADRKVMAFARTGGVVTELNVRRGQYVKEGDVIAVLSDEAREAQVAQARAILSQRKIELEARMKLVAQGTLPKLEQGNLESQYKAAESGLAQAQAERDRGMVRAPWSGVVTEVPTEVGQAVLSMMGKEIAQIVSLDPMLAVVEVAERKLDGVRVGEPAEIRLVTGAIATGKIRYVSKTAAPATRTYRVDVEVANPDGAIPDGITAEVSIPMAPVPAVRVPRSALTFASGGDLGVRVVDQDSKVAFVPVGVVEDEQQFMWVSGVAENARIIVQGQDFVREGQKVDAVDAEPPKTAAR